MRPLSDMRLPTNSEVASYIHFHGALPEHIVLSVGACRSKTTALARLIAASGGRAINQPIKSIHRWRSLGLPSPKFHLGGTESVLFIKETTGFLPGEGGFNPLVPLIAAAHRSGHDHALLDRLSVVLVCRSPESVLDSWLRVFSDRAPSRRGLLAEFVTAYATPFSIRRAAAELGLPTAVWVSDVPGDPYDQLSRLFSRLRLGLIPQMEWRADAQHAVFPQPPPFAPQAQGHAVRSATGYEPKTAAGSDLMNDDDRGLLRDHGLHRLYEHACRIFSNSFTDRGVTWMA